MKKSIIALAVAGAISAPMIGFTAQPTNQIKRDEDWKGSGKRKMSKLKQQENN